MTDTRSSPDTAEMLTARALVERHIAVFGYVPNPDKMKEAIAEALCRCAAQSSQVPVAWRSRWKTGSERDREWEMWTYRTEQPVPNDSQIIEALYAVPPSPVAGDLSQAVKNYFALWDRCGGSESISAEAFADARQAMRDALAVSSTDQPPPKVWLEAKAERDAGWHEYDDSVSAADVRGILATQGEIKPHIYSPDIQTMGDCRVCGHGQDKPWHSIPPAHRGDAT